VKGEKGSGKLSEGGAREMEISGRKDAWSSMVYVGLREWTNKKVFNRQAAVGGLGGRLVFGKRNRYQGDLHPREFVKRKSG
jgi:hypothetical protein